MESAWPIWAAVLCCTAVGSVGIVSYLRSRKRQRHPSRIGRASHRPLDDLDTKIEQLVKRAWGPREDSAGVELVLSPRSLSGLSHDDILAELLRHVRRVAPALSVPMMKPKIVVESIFGAAGQFLVQDGWVKISVGTEFFLNLSAAQAILCHELCHYVLEANGIRESTTLANERLTDVAMFVFGLGDIFLAGYQARPGIEYRRGHRLGYLTDAEYHSVDDAVFELRLSAEAQPTRVAEVQTLLKARISDAAARKRLLEHARKRHPTKSETELIQLVLEAYERDRR